MTGSKPLPDGLASDARQLVVELRALKVRAGLSLAELARRTPYSKSSWERYLNGKALPPQHAVTALGKLADADPARLTALWELANTAWHEGDAPAEPVSGTTAGPGRPRPGAPSAADVPAVRAEAGAGESDAGESDAEDAEDPGNADARDPDAGEARPPTGRRLGGSPLLWSAAVVALAAVAVSAAALFGAFGRDSGGHGARAGTPASDTPTRQVDVTCFAESCEGKDPKEAGCGDVWTSAKSRIAGVYVELRYSDACKAAWSRISWGRPGDIARVVGAGGRSYQRKVRYDTDTFSAMVSAPSPATARACVLLTSGVRGCTGWGGTHHLTEAPNPPSSLLTPGVTSVPARTAGGS